MTELLPCPFCGGEALEISFTDTIANGWIGCQSCRCFMDWVKNGKPQAIAAWNRRSEDERYKNALKEIIKLACESVEREKTLARLEAEVMARLEEHHETD